MKSILMGYEDYTNYTSEICHMLKRLGDYEFVEHILEYVDIEQLLLLGRKKHALYTVAIIDHVSKENNIPIKTELEPFRNMKMETLSFPKSVATYIHVVKNDKMKEKVLENALKEFLAYNIVETSIRDVS